MVKFYIIKILKLFLSFINRFILCYQKRINVLNSELLCVNVFSSSKSNKIEFIDASIKKTHVNVRGNNNSIIIRGVHSNLNINVFGDNNKFELGLGSKSIEGEMLVRGNNCFLSIGNRTTFGKKAYLVCMGIDNKILIGEENMFADYVEIWNTDSHPIYDMVGNLLNPSKPIEIGNHVWVGKKVCILKGSVIADNAIVGMASMISGQYIHSNTLNVGSPIRCIRNNVNWKRQFIQM